MKWEAGDRTAAVLWCAASMDLFNAIYIYIYIYIYIKRKSEIYRDRERRRSEKKERKSERRSWFNIYINDENELSLYIYVLVCITHLHTHAHISLCTHDHSHTHTHAHTQNIHICISEQSPLAGLQGYIRYPHIDAECMFVLVVLLLPGHMWGSIGVQHLWAHPCFSSSVLHVWFVQLG